MTLSLPTIRFAHAALYVTDLEAARDFFERYFDARSNSRYHNPRTGLMTYFLRFGEGDAQLELMSRPEVTAANRAPFDAGLAHIALCVGSRERVDALTDTLRAAGYTVVGAPRTTGDGYYESCIEGPGGCQIEITA